MLSVADMQQMMKHATNSTRMYIPARKMRIINHIDGNNCVYQTLMTSSIFLLGLTNAIILESSTYFPIGWIVNGIIGLVLMYGCSCSKIFMPHLFHVEKDPIKVYEYLYNNRRPVYEAFAWSLFVFLVLVFVIVYLIGVYIFDYYFLP